MWLKLTNYNGSTVDVNMDHVRDFSKGIEGTYLSHAAWRDYDPEYQSNPNFTRVKETPDQIRKMINAKKT
jgi:hypothetical protein